MCRTTRTPQGACCRESWRVWTLVGSSLGKSRPCMATESLVTTLGSQKAKDWRQERWVGPRTWYTNPCSSSTNSWCVVRRER